MGNEIFKDKITECIECNYIGCEELTLAVSKVKQLKQENEELKDHLSYEREMNTRIAQESVDVNGKLQQKLEKIKDRVQDIKFDDEKNIEVMNDILQIIESDGE